MAQIRSTIDEVALDCAGRCASERERSGRSKNVILKNEDVILRTALPVWRGSFGTRRLAERACNPMSQNKIRK